MAGQVATTQAMSQGWRRSPLPSNWPSIRRNVLERDEHHCQIGYPGCEIKATEVDHISDHDDHREVNLRSACGRCHRRRTREQMAAQRRERAALRKRPPEPHPGVLDPGG